MKFLFFNLILFFWLKGFAFGACNLKNKADLASLQPLKVRHCQDMKDSPKCQSLYSEILKETDQETLNTKQLRCLVDTHVTTFETLSVSAVSCLRNGVAGSVEDLGRWIGTTSAKAVLSLQADFDRQKDCDRNPINKQHIFTLYNKTVPSILRLTIPSNEELVSKSCAQVEADLYFAINEKRRWTSQKLDFKLYQKNPKLKPAEKDYLKWLGKQNEFAPVSNQNLIQFADSLLQEYENRIDCYNLEARAALRCEILFLVAQPAAIIKRRDILNVLFGRKRVKLQDRTTPLEREAEASLAPPMIPPDRQALIAKIESLGRQLDAELIQDLQRKLRPRTPISFDFKDATISARVVRIGPDGIQVERATPPYDRMTIPLETPIRNNTSTLHIQVPDLEGADTLPRR